MGEAIGPLIGRGRAADVFALGEDRVLRRYRRPWDAEPEAAVMRHLRQAGFPVPVVYSAHGGDLIMQRVTGPDMLADLARRPWRATRHARTLAALHDRLHGITAPESVPQRFAPGDRMLHLDLHPANVMLTAHGPVVIDWSNAVSGAPGFDVAMAVVIMSTSEIDDLPHWLRPFARALVTVFVRTFRATVHDDPAPYLRDAVRVRLEDPNIRPGEAVRLRGLVR